MTSTTDGDSTSSSERTRRLGVVARIGATAAAIGPLLHLLVRQCSQLGDRSIPCCDYAALDLGTSAFLRGEQFTGLYSRQGWRHPGPAPFLWNSVFRLVFGDSFAAARVGIVVLAIIAIAVVLWVLHDRLPTRAYLAGTAAVMFWLVRFDIAFLAEPWNPEMAMLWAFATVACAAMARDRCSTGWIVATVVTASMAVQCHLSAAPIALVAIAWAVPALWRRRSEAPLRRSALIALGAGIVLWLLPLWDLAFGDHNLWHILVVDDSGYTGGFAWSSMLTNLVEIVGVGPARQGFAFGAASPFLGTPSLDVATVLVAIVSLALAARLVVVRDRHPRLSTIALTSLVAIVATAALVAVSGGEYWPYVLMPLVGLGALVLASGLAAAVIDLPLERWRPARTALVAAETLAIVALAVILVTQVPSRFHIDDYSTPALRDITEQIDANCAALPDPTLVVIDDAVAWTDAITIVAALDRCTTVRAYDHLGFVAGEPYVWRHDDDANVLVYPGDQVRVKGTVVARNDAFEILAAPFSL